MKRIFLVVFLTLSGLLCMAQGYPNGLSADSVDPEGDERFINEMQMKMNAVRKHEHRPTVALVLSGGGARGSAHVGVLKLLEDMEIPIDMICGTSMGGLMGGLYSMGYSAVEIDSLLRAQDWNLTLSDDIDPKYKPYKEKEYRAKYLLTVPFHYEDAADNPKHQKKSVRFSQQRKDIDLGADAGDLTTQSGINTLASSLPSGYVAGFNVNNLLSSLTVGYQDSLAFSNLPIPYFAVATDMNSCKAKNWGNGSVRSAMRSTMSIPGLFSPVWTDDLVLVDGGTRNNFPADLARAMGADYVIGVELSAAAAETAEVDNIGNIVMRFIRMLGQDAYNKNITEADIVIRPNLEGYGMLSFDTAAIDTIVVRGYNAALEHKDELFAIKKQMLDAKPRINAPKAVDIGKTPVQVSSIEFAGLSDHESRTMMRKIGLKVDKKIDRKEMDDAMAEIISVPAFESATYSLLGSQEPYKLVFDCARKPVHQLGMGFRMDTQDWAAILVNVGLNTNKIEGSKLDFESRIAQNFYAKLHYSLDILALPTINAEIKLFGNNHDYLTTAADALINAKYRGDEESIYLSNSRWTALNLQAGVKNEHFKTRRLLSDYVNYTGEYEDAQKYLNGDFFSAFLNADIYTYDSKYFPRKGIDFNAKAKWVFKHNCPIVSFDLGHAFSFGEHFTIVADAHARSVMKPAPCLFMTNALGGMMAGRYWDQQIPFVGFERMYLCDDNVFVLNAEFRVNATKNLFFSAMAGGFDSCASLDNILSDMSTSVLGFAGQVSYNTIGGPIRARLSWSTLDRKLSYIISAGFDF